MSAKVITLNSAEPAAGKTHFAAGLACWLREHGLGAAPLHLSEAAGDPVPCPEGGSVSRAAALLAEVSGLMPEPVYESGWEALEGLRERFDVVIVEAAPGAAVPGGWPGLSLARENGRILPAGFAPLPEFQRDLMPVYSRELAALPAWRLVSAPRCAVVSLPHLDNFTDYQLLRGSEWLTAPAIGRFANIFLPYSTNIAHDLEWLEETGLAGWIAAQCEGGARLSVCGWDYAGAERCEPGDLLDFRVLSPLIGRRVPPPMPDEALRHRLAVWFGEWPSIGEFNRAFL